jgi:hypothetical protein
LVSSSIIVKAGNSDIFVTKTWGRMDMKIPILQMVTLGMVCAAPALAHEVDQRIGGYSSSDGESRSMAWMNGRADVPAMASGEIVSSLTVNANIERVRVSGEANTEYMKTHFPDGQRLEQTFGMDSDWTYSKTTNFAFGGSISGDGVVKTTSKRASIGQWLLGDQLRIGVSGSTTETKRPEARILDYDSVTILLKPRMVSTSAGLSVKAILNPTTIVNGDYSKVQSTERPALQSWAVGARQYIPSCECSVHGDMARVINLGALNTNMSTGQLMGTQVSVSYLQTLWRDGHARLSYRYAREDEFTRAYNDHLVFGSDSYTAAISHEFQKTRIQGRDRPLLVDLAATRYIDNKRAAGTTMEMGGSVKF